MDELAYYATPGQMTLLPDDSRLAGVPSDVAGIVGTLQGLMMHRVEADRLGIEVTEERRGEEQLRSASAMVARMGELDPSPLLGPRPPDCRLVVNCRHFAVLTCALLRRVGVPARARVGSPDTSRPPATPTTGSSSAGTAAAGSALTRMRRRGPTSTRSTCRPGASRRPVTHGGCAGPAVPTPRTSAPGSGWARG
jgi:hypothetical protein